MNAGRSGSSRARRVVASAGLTLCFAGVGRMTEGIAVPIEAHRAQIWLDRGFDVRLATGRRSPGVSVATANAPLPQQSAPRHKQRTVEAAVTKQAIGTPARC